MKKYYYFNIFIFYFLFKIAPAFSQATTFTKPDTTGNLLFIENKNQWPAFIKYECNLQNGKLYLENNRFTFSLLNGDDIEKVHGSPNQGSHKIDKNKVIIHGHAYRETFVNANPDIAFSNSVKANYYSNYFIGNDPKHWASDVLLYHVITYKNLYDGIDLTVYSKVNELTYDFTVSAGADADAIQLAYDGLDGMYLADGNLVLKTSIGNNVEEKPYAYQIINGQKIEVTCNYLLDGTHASFSFPLGYNHKYPLVIDPQFVFGTYSGSTSDNWGFTATYDALGDMYIAGTVYGSGYPVTTGAFQTAFKGGTGIPSNFNYLGDDIAIAKFNPTGTTILYATYLGGTDDEQPHSLVVNNAGDLLVYGRSYSKDFPVTSTAYQQVNNGGWDMIISEFNSTGTSLLASTYVGGSGNDGLNIEAGYNTASLKVNYGDDARGEIIVDKSDNVYVGTCTQSTDFPTTVGAYQTTAKGGQEGCVFKMNNALSLMLWSTYLGGSSDDAAYSLKIDNNKNVYVCGGTASSDFPTTAGALQPNYGGNIDGFITKLSSDGSKILHSTFIGTSAYDQTYFLDVDSTFNIYVTGQSLGNAPTTAGVYSNPNSAQFIEKLDSTLTTQLFYTVFGDGVTEINISPTAFMIDTCENIYVAGWGGYVNFQGSTFNMALTSDAFQSKTNGDDFYFIVLKKDATALMYATYFGDASDEQHVDGGTSRFDKDGYMYEAICGGCGEHSGLPTTPGCWSNTNNSDNCNEAAIKFKFDLDGPTAAFTPSPFKGCIPLTVNFLNQSTGAQAFEWVFDGNNSDTSTQTNPTFVFKDTGTFKVRLIAINSLDCRITDTTYATIKVTNNFLKDSVTSVTKNFCDSIQATFTAVGNGGATFNWDFGDGTTSALKSPSHTFKKPGIDTITLIVYDTAFCNPYDTTTSFINFTDIVTALIQDTLYKGCAPFTINFNDFGFGGKTFVWHFGDGDSSTLKDPSHTYSTPGTYEVSLFAYDPSTCNQKDSGFAKIIVYHSAPIVAFTASPTLVQYNNPVIFTDNTTGATSYLWSFGDGDTSMVFAPKPHNYTTDGSYNVCLVAKDTASPCSDSVCTLITVHIIPILDAPNAFSPNGDGKNDVFYAKGQGMATIDFKIFNRWGQLVFETHDLSIGWDGTYNGQPQEMEVYVWTLEGTALDGSHVFKKGNVTLLR